jgi:hypothetical protein
MRSARANVATLDKENQENRTGKKQSKPAVKICVDKVYMDESNGGEHRKQASVRHSVKMCIKDSVQTKKQVRGLQPRGGNEQVQALRSMR